MTAVPGPHRDSALRVAPCREVDVPLLMDFIGTQWRAGHILARDEPLLRWQFAPGLVRDHDRSGLSVLLAWLGSDLVGMLGLTGFSLNVTGDQFPAMWLSHWFAAPALRRHSVAVSLILAARDFGVEALATLGANEVSTKLLGRLGFEVIPSLPRWVGVFDAAAAGELFVAADRGIRRAEVARLCESYAVAPHTQDSGSRGGEIVGWSEATGAAWDRFWDETLAKRLVGASRDAAYLRWRYVEHPSFEYHLRFARRDSDGAIEGLVVFRVEQMRDGAVRVLRIVEFLASPAGERKLVWAVLEAARDAGVAIADFYCSSASAAQGLARAGFRCEPTKSPGTIAFPSRFQPLDPGHFPMTTLVRLPQAWRGTLARLTSEGRLYITKSDGDQDRPN